MTRDEAIEVLNQGGTLTTPVMNEHSKYSFRLNVIRGMDKIHYSYLTYHPSESLIALSNQQVENFINRYYKAEEIKNENSF